MPDTWTLETPDGPYTLNPTFSAPKYQPGSVAGPGALRRDERTTYQRSGDGLPTPGPLTLMGIVWRDDQNQALILQELNAIRAAVAVCTSVTRTNNAGTYTYDRLAGGATPEITRDGLGGWMVKLDLWPGRADPTFLPATPGIPVFIAAVTASSDPDGPGVETGSIAIPAGVQPGDLMLLRIVARSTEAIPSAVIAPSTPGWTTTGDPNLIGSANILCVKTATTELPSDLVEWGLTGSYDRMRWHATLLVYRGDAQVVVQQGGGSSNGPEGTSPSVDMPMPGLRVTFWANQIAREFNTPGWTPPPGVTVRTQQTPPSSSSGPFKFTTLVTEDPVPAGATGTLTAQQEHTFYSSGDPFYLWMSRLTVGITSPPA